jgi:hypothetical protein
MNFQIFFLLLWVIFALLDPESESGSTDLIESESNPDPQPWLQDQALAGGLQLLKHRRRLLSAAAGSSGSNPLLTAARKRYQCHLCLKYFSQSSGLRSHLRTHAGIRPYSCQICRKSFGQSSHLTGHMRIHTGERPYSCEVCKRTFSQKGNLMEHMKRLHP